MTRTITVPSGMTVMVVPMFPRVSSAALDHCSREHVRRVAAEQLSALEGAMPELVRYVHSLEREARVLRSVALGSDATASEFR